MDETVGRAAQEIAGGRVVIAFLVPVVLLVALAVCGVLGWCSDSREGMPK
jgi:hypothetical protein